jgi:hypothetical protein
MGLHQSGWPLGNYGAIRIHEFAGSAVGIASNEFPQPIDMTIIDITFELSATLKTMLNPVSLFTCAVHFWVELKACKLPCCYRIRSASLHLSLMSDIVFCNNSIGG